MFAWFAHLVEDCYFDSVEMFFLIAGHTHSPIDQNFSVQGAAIARADFIGSKLAMAELFLAAHDVTKQKNKDARIQKVIEMETYHDYDEKYSAVINPLFKYHSGPHRYILHEALSATRSTECDISDGHRLFRTETTSSAKFLKGSSSTPKTDFPSRC